MKKIVQSAYNIIVNLGYASIIETDNLDFTKQETSDIVQGIIFIIDEQYDLSYLKQIEELDTNYYFYYHEKERI